MKVPKSLKIKNKYIYNEDEPTLAELNSSHRRSQAKCQLEQASYIKRVKYFCLPYNKHLINRA